MFQTVFAIIFAALSVIFIAVGCAAFILHARQPDTWLVRFSMVCDVMALIMAVLAGCLLHAVAA